MDSLGGTTPEKEKKGGKLNTICTCHNFFSLSSVQILRVAKALSLHRKSLVPPLLNTKFFFDSLVSQLSALATLRPIWGRVGQGAFELSMPQIRKCHFLE